MTSALATYRRELAELHILERYDAIRASRGHDYGSGQRGAELARRRRALEAPERYRELPYIEAPTALELAEAWKRVGAPRMRRALAELERNYYGSERARETSPTARTVSAWRTVAKLCELEARSDV